MGSTKISLTKCARCERLFVTEELNDDGLCNACHSGSLSQLSVDIAKELRALPEEADLYASARRIEVARQSTTTALEIINAIAKRIHSDPSSPLLTQFNVFAGNAEIADQTLVRIKELLDKHLIAIDQDDLVWRIEFVLNLFEERSDELHTLQMKLAGEI